MFSGALGIMVASPTDLVKVRLQAEGKLPPGVPRRYSGAMNAYSTIVRKVKFSLYIGIVLSISIIHPTCTNLSKTCQNMEQRGYAFLYVEFRSNLLNTEYNLPGVAMFVCQLCKYIVMHVSICMHGFM